MYVNRKENWFWNIGNGKVYFETWSPGKINLSVGKVFEICFPEKKEKNSRYIIMYDNLS